MKSHKLKFKILHFVLSFLTFIFAFSIQPLAATTAENATLIVKLKSADDLPKLQSYGSTELLFDNIYRLKAYHLPLTTYRLSNQPWMEFAEQDRTVKAAALVTDPLYTLDPTEETKQWYLSKIEVTRAWDKTIGSPNIIVAVVDTGINGQHEDLNDGRVIRGLINYCQVMNPAEDDCLLHITSEVDAGVNSDDNGHGTIVAGIIGAETGNGKGIAGINWQTKLMPVKALDHKGEGLASDVAMGMKWAVDHGAKIINLSIGGGGLGGSEILQEAVSYAYRNNVLVVAAAGNDAAEAGGNLNTNPVVPVCADGGENMVIGVAAVDILDRKAGFSSFGSKCVDIAAPGATNFISREDKKGIVSTYYDPVRPGKNDLYVSALGTSLAAPMVSGVAALTRAAFPDLAVAVLRDRLIASADNIDASNATGCDGKSCVGQIGAGRLNAYKSLNALQLFSSGVLIEGPSGVFLVERGQRRPMAEFVKNQRFAGITPVQTEQQQIDALPVGQPLPPVDGTIIKEPGAPTVYLLEDGVMQALSYAVFVSRGLKFENVSVLAAEIVSTYTRGADAGLPNNALLKAPDHPAVFVFENGSRRLVSYFVFKQRGFDKQPIVMPSPEELGRYSTENSLYPPFDGTLIKGDGSATVYVVEGRVLRGLSGQAFASRGYNFADVETVPQNEVEQYQKGADIQ